ncbi:MAG: type II toxin-antitoxin system VapB15 family antitoxin [Mariniphaga sp.]
MVQYIIVEMENSSIQITLSYNQILSLVNQLPEKYKAKLSRELAKEAKEQRLSKLLESFRTDEISQEEIDAEVEAVRAELYA